MLWLFLASKMRGNFLTIPVGYSVKLDCSADGNPRPIVKWYKGGKFFKERKGGKKLYLSRWTTLFSLKDLVPSDAGSYMCNVSNSYGWISHTYKLDVHGKTKNPSNFSGQCRLWRVLTVLFIWEKECSNSFSQYKSHLKSQIKINIASNETIDVFELHGYKVNWLYWFI